jgi:hypothetical protein
METKKSWLAGRGLGANEDLQVAGKHKKYGAEMRDRGNSVHFSCTEWAVRRFSESAGQDSFRLRGVSALLVEQVFALISFAFSTMLG